MNAIDALARSIANVDNRLRKLSSRETVTPNWILATLLNSWANVSAPLAPYAEASYYALGTTVFLRGHIGGGFPPSVAFTLPANYRPDGRLEFTIPSDLGLGILRVDANGDVTIVDGGGVIYALDSVSFRAA